MRTAKFWGSGFAEHPPSHTNRVALTAHPHAVTFLSKHTSSQPQTKKLEEATDMPLQCLNPSRETDPSIRLEAARQAPFQGAQLKSMVKVVTTSLLGIVFLS